MFVISARRAFSEEKVSSKSNSSRGGGGNSLKAGGKTLKIRISTVYCHTFFLHFTDLSDNSFGLKTGLEDTFYKVKNNFKAHSKRYTF